MITHAIHPPRTPAAVRSACLGCEDCTGLCRAVADLITVPQLVLGSGAGR
jgi:hypothetical protein